MLTDYQSLSNITEILNPYRVVEVGQNQTKA